MVWLASIDSALIVLRFRMLMRGGQEPFGEPPRWGRDTGAYVLVIVGLVMIAAILAIIGVSLQ